MAACRIVNAAVETAVEEIRTASTDYTTAANEFISAFNSAIAEMEGASKDALDQFFKEKVVPFISEDIPGAVSGMADLLEANRSNFADIDQQIADSILNG
ncbi:MAG: hypothetical protein PUE12_01570 [Oscillospiraceae bacterium]|nr:hypothetical protein [Oscillospiraceae bacterium]